MIYYYERYSPELGKVKERGFCTFNFKSGYIEAQWDFEEYECPDIVVPLLNKDNPFIDKEGFIATENENPDYEVDEDGEPLNDEEPYIKTYDHLMLYIVPQNLIPMIKGMSDFLCYRLAVYLSDSRQYQKLGRKLSFSFRKQIEDYKLKEQQRRLEIQEEIDNNIRNTVLGRGL